MSHALADPLAWALAAFRDDALAKGYERAADYYRGFADLSFTNGAYRTAFRDFLEAEGLNYCRRLVDTHADRLRVIGFSDEHAGDAPIDDPDAPAGGGATADAGAKTDDPPAAKAWALWRAGRMGKRSGEVHQEMLVCGDAYVVVERHPVTGEVCVWPQRAAQVRVHYGDERPGEVDVAAKKWRLHDGRARLNLYFVDRVEKYVTRHKEESGPLVRRTLDRYQDAADADWPVRLAVADTVPVFHFANNARTGELGTSKLADVMGTQDKLNYVVHSMLAIDEYGIFRQRWAIGVEPLTDPITGEVLKGPDGRPLSPFRSGPGEIWAVGPGDGETRPQFGEFGVTPTQQYLDQKEAFAVDMARAAAVPIHHLLGTGTPTSGEELKMREAPLIAETEDRHGSVGDGWSAVQRYVLRLADGTEAPGLVTEWQSASPRSEREAAELGALYLQSGWPEEEVWRFQGKTEDEVRRMRAERSAAQAAEAQRQEAATARELARFAAGGERGGDDGEEVA